MQRHYALNVRQTVISGVYYMVVSTFLTNMGVQVALPPTAITPPFAAPGRCTVLRLTNPKPAW